VDVDKRCDLCSVSGNIQECFRSHGVGYQEKYADGEILEREKIAPALPIYALLLTTIRKLVGRMLVRASDEEQAVQSKTP
jgi:hypothetical protein